MSVAIKWNSTDNIFTFDDMLNQMFECTSDVLLNRETESGGAWAPAADMYETPAAMVVEVELTGIDKNSLEILFQADCLLLRGERPLSPAMQAAKIHRVERLYGRFQRIFRIPQPIEAQQISAVYEQGMLTITLLKRTPNENSS